MRLNRIYTTENVNVVLKFLKSATVIEKFLVLYNNKYNQKPPHIYVMTKWMTNDYFFVIKLYIGFHPWLYLLLLSFMPESIYFSTLLCHN